VNRPAKLFRGSELPHLLILLALVVGGWSVVAWKVAHPKPPPPPPLVVEQAPSHPPPDGSIEFRGIQDKAPLNPRENPAYRILIDRVRKTPAGQLAAESRTVLFPQLIETPERYRGLPLHVEGVIRRVIAHEVRGSTVFPSGKFYEAWIFTSDSQKFPWLLSFEDAPPGLEVGDKIHQNVRFDGYFFKLMAYIAGDVPRFAPLLVGRFPSTAFQPTQAPAMSISARDAVLWVVLALSLYLLVRLWMTLRRTYGPARPDRPKALPGDRIEPEDLSAWLNQVGDEETADQAEDWRR
jgi:hypothetical protein